MPVESLPADPVPRRLVSADLVNASRNRAFGAVRVFGHDAIETARDAVLEMSETTQAANTVLGRQSLIRVFTPGWFAVLYHDGRHEVDNAAQFREKALREIEVMFEGLVEKRGGKSAKLSVDGEVWRPRLPEEGLRIVSETQRVKFHLLPKDYVVLASLTEEAETGLSEFCRQLAEVRAATEREKACRRCSGARRKSRSWTRSDRGRV